MVRRTSPEQARKFPRAPAVTVGAVALCAAELFGGHLQVSGNTRLLTHSYEAEAFVEPTQVIAMPGFMASAHNLHNHLQAVMPEQVDILTVQYGDDFSIEVIARELLEQLHREHGKNHMPDVVMYGHSMGGYIGVLTATELAKQGVPIKTIVLDSAPQQTSDVQNAAEQTAVQALSFLHRFAELTDDTVRGGLGNRGLFETPSALAQDGVSFKKRAKRIFSSPLPKLQEQNNLVALKTTNIFSNSRPEFRTASAELAEQGVRVMYIGKAAVDGGSPGHSRPVPDGVVNVGKAINSWREHFPDMEVLPLVGGGHGISWDKRDAYSAQLAEPMAAIRREALDDRFRQIRPLRTPLH
jgi:pimeloyl-ACP methyl ester carboxylesterase